jgi:hypothetical protein
MCGCGRVGAFFLARSILLPSSLACSRVMPAARGSGQHWPGTPWRPTPVAASCGPPSLRHPLPARDCREGRAARCADQKPARAIRHPVPVRPGPALVRRAGPRYLQCPARSGNTRQGRRPAHHPRRQQRPARHGIQPAPSVSRNRRNTQSPARLPRRRHARLDLPTRPSWPQPGPQCRRGTRQHADSASGRAYRTAPGPRGRPPGAQRLGHDRFVGRRGTAHLRTRRQCRRARVRTDRIGHLHAPPPERPSCHHMRSLRQLTPTFRRPSQPTRPANGAAA